MHGAQLWYHKILSGVLQHSGAHDPTTTLSNCTFHAHPGTRFTKQVELSHAMLLPRRAFQAPDWEGLQQEHVLLPALGLSDCAQETWGSSTWLW